MSLILVIVHIVVCIALIMIVLLQTGKGADMGAAFGGGSSQTLFGSTGASTFLSKATTLVAVVFMVTCMSLAYLSTNRTSSSIVLDDVTEVEQKTDEVPVEQTNVGQETDTTETPVGSTETETDATETQTDSTESAVAPVVESAGGEQAETGEDVPE